MKGKRVWTPEMIARAKELRAQGWSGQAIDVELGLLIGSTVRKFNYQPRGAGASDHYVSPIKAPADVLAARDARYAAANLRDFTATHCGDPPPGYSAYDRARKAAEIPDLSDAPIRPISATVTYYPQVSTRGFVGSRSWRRRGEWWPTGRRRVPLDEICRLWNEGLFRARDCCCAGRS